MAPRTPRRCCSRPSAPIGAASAATSHACNRPAGQRVEIPYEGTTLPGHFFTLGETTGRRPTLVVNNGSDGPVTTLWPPLGAGAVARGYNVLVFDGPGQQSMLFERRVPFRYDWEAVITPVVDFLSARPDVDPERIALHGVSQGGYWVPRAVAFEHRIAAGVADPGVYDAFEHWWNALPQPPRDCLDAGDQHRFDQHRFDQLMAEGMQQATAGERQNWEWRAKPYGKTSANDVVTEARRYTLEGVAGQITTPMLITDPDGEQFWPGQSQRLHDVLPGPKRLVRFTVAEGADRHCEPMARSLLEQRLLDWLDETITR
jgi:prolyl oligopeptidase family protein